MKEENNIKSILKEVEMLDTSDKDFQEKLDFALRSTNSNSDYRNDRERPYNGQSWTDQGERGKTEVKGLTLRDVVDCLIMAMIESSPLPEEYDNLSEVEKCWDLSNWDSNKGEGAIPTQYLLDNQDKYIAFKVQLGTWRYQDVYKLDWERMDPLAISQNLVCQIEKMMGIFPNI